MRKLIMGMVDFRDRMLPQYVERFRELALGGVIGPHALRVVRCAGFVAVILFPALARFFLRERTQHESA